MAGLTLDWLHLVTLLGALQGVLLSGALAAKRRNRTANRLLAVTMLAFSLHLATAVYHAAGLEQRFPHFFGIGYPLPFLYGPLIYLYALTAADRNRGLHWRDAIHVLPFLVVVAWGFPIYLMSGAGKLAFYHRLQTGQILPFIAITTPLKFVSGVSYAVATVVVLHRHRRRVMESYSSLERVNLRWLVWLSAGAAFIWLLATAFQIVEATGVAAVGNSDDIVSVLIAVFVYGIGYMGLRQPEIFRFETAEHRIPADLLRSTAGGASPPAARPAPETEPLPLTVDVARSPEAPDLTTVTPAEETPRYERSGLSDREAARLEASLIRVMEADRPWRNSELTLADLAERLDTTPHKLSEVLNAQVGQTFYDFVNGYRVREVQRRIAAGDARRLTMLSLALDAGFASKSTFNTVFKKHTSQTPSAYRQAAGA